MFPTLLLIRVNHSVDAFLVNRTVKYLVPWVLNKSFVAPLGDNIEPERNHDDEHDIKSCHGNGTDSDAVDDEESEPKIERNSNINLVEEWNDDYKVV